MSAADRWVLLGLLTSMKNPDPDQNPLTVGMDMGMMRFDTRTRWYVFASLSPSLLPILTKIDSIKPRRNFFSKLITTWSDLSMMHMRSSSTGTSLGVAHERTRAGARKAQSFHEEMLSYVFHTQPHDVLQEVAAQELAIPSSLLAYTHKPHLCSRAATDRFARTGASTKASVSSSQMRLPANLGRL